MNWVASLHATLEGGEAVVLVTLVQVRGHAPREPGAKMIVTRDATLGSIGGGNLEATAVERARAMLSGGTRAPSLLTLRLTDNAPAQHGKQCCGGEVTVLLEPISPHRPSVAVFGLGHVGFALSRILATLPIDLHLVDSRAGQLERERLASVAGNARVHVHHAPIPELPLQRFPAGTHVVVLTHDHAEDLAVLDAALRRSDLGFIGLIGSKVKWLRFQEQLRAEGHTPEAIARVTSPIGLDGIHGKTPEVIAISVAAQLTQHLESQPTPSEVTNA